MTDFVIGLVRTWVPIGAGALISWLVTLGINLDAGTEAALVTFGTGLIIGIYYTIVRLLAEKVPAVGILLGYNKAPAYNNE